MSKQNSFEFLVSGPFKGDPSHAAIDQLYHADETGVVTELLGQLERDSLFTDQVMARAHSLVAAVRERKQKQGVLDAFMQQYDLSSEEGVVLMCLAEALLRIPDSETAEKLIADKLLSADWESHLGKSTSVLVNASTWGLMLTGKLVGLGNKTRKDFRTALGRMINRSGEPVVRTAILQAMRIMGFQYVMGRNINEALDRADKKNNRIYRYSFDMLGEAAMTGPDADHYLEAYKSAISVIGSRRGEGDIFSAPSISVKLSALHPRYEYSQRDRVLTELTPRLLSLALLARENNIALTVDAEEADRLMLSLNLFEDVLADPALSGWDGFGLAVQTYQKRAMAIFEDLAAVARRTGHRIPVRLVKGAYWDTEIKHAQVEGLDGYPVFTRKANTDVSYLACAQRVLALRQEFYPQFATHNAHTIAMITEMAGDRLDYEFQRLHGMGEDLYGKVMTAPGYNHACRVYAPVGSHEDLLPYLVRRLLENGANTSFVNRIVDEKLSVDKVAEDPIARTKAVESIFHPAIPLPVDMYGSGRKNTRGINLANESEVLKLAGEMQEFSGVTWIAQPQLAAANATDSGPVEPVEDPARAGRIIGEVRNSTPHQVDKAIEDAAAFAPEWDDVPVAERAACLRRAADLMEARMPEYMVLCTREAGKTIEDGVAEVREAVDFLRYYALQAEKLMSEPTVMDGPTGELNQLSLHGRGVFVCISPWNFPLAIFIGQVSAALVSGNPVLAKPAEQTPIVASRAVALLHEAGIPVAALQFLPGDGASVGARLTRDPRICGVAFTGSTETARLINQTLASRDAPLAALVAETGGQNAMLVDSSALPEQVVADVIGSAFLSAGQRCSALRVLFVQEDIAERVTEMLAGAMAELKMGDPAMLSTDIGPVIDQQALQTLEEHAEKMESNGRLIARAHLPASLTGNYFAPCAFEIDNIGMLEREVFGPILHVVRFAASDIGQVIEQINATGYGLTLGVHSRIERTQDDVAKQARVGNCYINRTMTGAVVGVQPFGGEGLSGTGPKAGGPHYLLRFIIERTLTVNTAAVGGNASLLAMED